MESVFGLLSNIFTAKHLEEQQSIKQMPDAQLYVYINVDMMCFNIMGVFLVGLQMIALQGHVDPDVSDPPPPILDDLTTHRSPQHLQTVTPVTCSHL